jgi:hypothetical protein
MGHMQQGGWDPMRQTETQTATFQTPRPVRPNSVCTAAVSSGGSNTGRAATPPSAAPACPQSHLLLDSSPNRPQTKGGVTPDT